MVLTLYSFVVYEPQNKEQTFPYTSAVWLCITEVETVYCAVRVESYKTDDFSLKG
jgi:hypothetical protein